jgi:hypothetical protein
MLFSKEGRKKDKGFRFANIDDGEYPTRRVNIWPISAAN